MATNYTIKYADKIAERFHQASITDAACGNEYSFVGAKTIRIYSVDVVPEQDYNRTADGNRFGVPKNLGDTIQEMTMQEARAFTFVIETVDNSDQAIEKSAGRALRRQLDEVTVPTMDKYRLRKWCEGANVQHQLSAEPNKSTIVEAIIDTNAKMTEALVPLANRTLFITTEMYKLLKQNPAARLVRTARFLCWTSSPSMPQANSHTEGFTTRAQTENAPWISSRRGLVARQLTYSTRA